MAFDLGDPVPLSVEIRDSTGVLANAGSVALSVTQPDGTAATISNPVTPASTGVYAYSFVPTQAGRHAVHWVATGVNASAYTDAFDVDPAATLAIVSLAEAKAHLQIPATDTTSDEELRGFILAASEWVEGRIGPVMQRTFTETHPPTSTGTLVLNRAPLVSLTSISATYGYGYTWDVATLYPDLEAGIVHTGITSATFAYPVTVTYVAGRAVVPRSVQIACLMYLKALWETQRGASSVPVQGFEEEGISPAGGLLVYKAEQLLEQHRLPPAVA